MGRRFIILTFLGLIICLGLSLGGVDESHKAAFQRGINDLRRKIAANTTCDIDGYMNLGNRFAVLQGRAHDAAASYAAAMQCDPRAGLPPYNLGALLSRAGEDNLALQQMQRSILLDPTGQWSHLPWQGIGIIRTRQGRITEAVHAYRQALRLAPQDAGSHLSLAQALRSARQPKAALRLANHAVQLAPHDMEALLEVGRCLIDMDRVGEAVMVWRAGVKAGIDLSSFLDVARAREASLAAAPPPLYHGPSTEPEVPEEPAAGEGNETGPCRVAVDGASEHLPPHGLPPPQQPCRGHLAASRLQAVLHRLQYPPRCRRLESAVWEAPLYGFGSVVNYAVSSLASSLEQGDVFVPAVWSLPGYTSKALCAADRSLACFFAAPTNCSVHVPARIVPVRPDPHPGRVPRGFGDWGENGAFWYRTGLLRFLWRLKPGLLSRIERAKVAMGYRRPILAIHVRHGDACSGRGVGGARTCFALEAYMAPARKFREKYGINRIFLATDDEASVAWARRHPDGFEWVVPNLDRSKYVSATLIEERLIAAGASREGAAGGEEVEAEKGDHLDAGQEGETIIQEIEMLASADAFIGQFSGNVDRVAFSLMASRLGRIPPYVSLDIPWCSHWGHERRQRNGKYYFC